MEPSDVPFRIPILAVLLLSASVRQCRSQEVGSEIDVGVAVSLVRGAVDGVPRDIPGGVPPTTRFVSSEWSSMPKVWFRFWRISTGRKVVPHRVNGITAYRLKEETGGIGNLDYVGGELSHRNIDYRGGYKETCFGVACIPYPEKGRNFFLAGRKYMIKFDDCEAWIEVGFPAFLERGEVVECDFVFYGKNASPLEAERTPGLEEGALPRMVVDCPFVPVLGNGRSPMSWARYYSPRGNGEHVISDLAFGKDVAFEAKRLARGGTLLVGPVFGSTPRYVIRNVGKETIRLPEDSTLSFPPEEAVKTLFRLPGSLGDLTRLRWIKLRLDPNDVFAVSGFAPGNAKECGGELRVAERELDWLCWPGRYRMEVETDPAGPKAGDPYAWDLGWVDIPRAPEGKPVELPEGKVIRTISAKELERPKPEAVPPEEARPPAEQKGEPDGAHREKPEAPVAPSAESLLGAGAWNECLARIGTDYARGEDAPRGRPRRAAAPRTPLVRFGIEPVAMAAASAKALGGTATEEWGERLYGSDPIGRKAYDAFLAMLGGDFSRLIPLIEAMDPAVRARGQTFDWMAAAEMLERAAGTKPERASWQALAGAFRLLSVWRRPVWDEGRSLAMVEPFTKLPAETRKRIVDGLVGYEGPLAERLRNAYNSKLPPLLRKKLVTDPELVRLLAYSLPNARARDAMMNQMGQQPPEVVSGVAQVNLDLARKDDPEALCAAAHGFARGGDRAKAIELLREGEGRFGYPARQRIRRMLFAMLRAEPAGGGPGQLRPPGRGQSPEQFPALVAEMERREAQSGLPPGELAMARGDLHGVFGDSAKAAAAYGKAFGLAADATLQRTAWACWAAFDPKGAWAERGRLDALFAGATAETAPELGELACRVLGAGILAGDEQQALAWAAARLPALRKTPGGSRALCFLLLWRLLSPDADPAAILKGENERLAGLDDNSLLSLVDSFCGNSRMCVHLQADVDHKLGKLLQSRRDGADWRVGSAVALAAMPHFRDLRQAPYLWRKVLVACPAPPRPDAPADPAPKAEPLSEDECQRHCTALTAACVASLARTVPGSRPQVVNAFLDASSDMLQREGGKRFLPQAQTLGLATIAYAGEHGMRGRPLVRFLKRHVEGLRQCAAPEATVQEYVGAVRKAFPADRDVQRFLAQIEPPPKP